MSCAGKSSDKILTKIFYFIRRGNFSVIYIYRWAWFPSSGECNMNRFCFVHFNTPFASPGANFVKAFPQCLDVSTQCLLTASTAVSSANVPISPRLFIGKSAVKSIYIIGPRTLPCWTPDFIWCSYINLISILNKVIATIQVIIIILARTPDIGQGLGRILSSRARRQEQT